MNGNNMRIQPSDKTCTRCGGVLRITGGEEWGFETTCTSCGEDFWFAPDTLGNAGRVYHQLALKQYNPEVHRWMANWKVAA